LADFIAISRCLNDGTSASALEHRFRPLKKEALEMQAGTTCENNLAPPHRHFLTLPSFLSVTTSHFTSMKHLLTVLQPLQVHIKVVTAATQVTVPLAPHPRRELPASVPARRRLRLEMTTMKRFLILVLPRREC